MPEQGDIVLIPVRNWFTARRILVMAFALLAAYIYFVAFYLSAQFPADAKTVALLQDAQDSWYIPLVVRFAPTALVFGLAVLVATAVVLLALERRRRWWLLTGLWFGGLALASSFLLLPVYTINLWYLRSQNPQWAAVNYPKIQDFLVMPVLSLLYAIGPVLAYLMIVAPLWLLVGLGMAMAPRLQHLRRSNVRQG